MAHHHHEVDIIRVKNALGRLVLVIAWNALITLVELIGGLLSGSLSLISDAAHNFSDDIAVWFSFTALRLNQQPKDETFTFGFKRAEILAAFFNALVLIGIGGYLIVEAIGRFNHPSSIHGQTMILVAVLGFVANALGTFLLKENADENLNFRSAYLHLLSDSISSLGVIIGGIVIYYWNFYLIDPLLTVLISAYILWEAYKIVWNTMRILMMTTPRDLDLQRIKTTIETVPGVKNIHHAHLWHVNEYDIHFEAHVVVQNMSVGETHQIYEQISGLLEEMFDINHTTVQFECGLFTEAQLV